MYNTISTECITYLIIVLEPEFKLQENVIGQQRLFFDPSNEGSSILTGVFNFSNTGPVDEFCREFTVYVRVCKLCILLVWQFYYFLCS